MLAKYLSKTRIYKTNDIELEIPPQVFHPGFFSSTRLLLQYINGLSLPGKKFLELGAGSGLISMTAAKKGALVTATDINPVAVEFLQKNSLQNGINIRVIHSDLFQHIPPQAFDIIAINPPYYKKQPQTFAEYAWYCGENGEYFQRLFHTIGDYIHKDSVVLMVLSEVCDINLISKLITDEKFYLEKLITKKSLGEDFYIYTITDIP